MRRPEISELSRTVKKDGWELDIVIMDDGEGKWLLSIHDDSGGGTHWTESFDTEQRALDEALKAIDEEGVASFTVPQPWRPPN